MDLRSSEYFEFIFIEHLSLICFSTASEISTTKFNYGLHYGSFGTLDLPPNDTMFKVSCSRRYRMENPQISENM